MKIKCKKCKYGWITKSKMLLVSCPCCGNKVRVKKQKVEEEEEDSYRNHL